MGGQNVDGDAFPNFFGTSAAPRMPQGYNRDGIGFEEKFMGKLHLKCEAAYGTDLWRCTVRVRFQFW
jgi:hypothetical protein